MPSKRSQIILTVTDQATGQEATIPLKRRRWEEVKTFLAPDIQTALAPMIEKIVAENFALLTTGKAPKVEPKKVTKSRS